MTFGNVRGRYLYRPLDPGRYPDGIEQRAPGTLAAWRRHFPDARPAVLDPEDWIENAVILEAAERLGLRLTVLPTPPAMHVSGGVDGVPLARPGRPVGAMLGTWMSNDFIRGLPVDIDPVLPDARSVRAALRYASSRTFLRHAGRPLALATADPSGPGGLEAALREVVTATGSGEVFVKTVQKDWAAPFTVDPRSTRRLWDQLTAADARQDAEGLSSYGLEWLPVRHEGSSRPVLLVQGRLQPTFEYRLVIIGDQPCTGAGCIEQFTPAENTAVFDPQMEPVRGDGQVVVRDDLTRRYLEFARGFCEDFAAEHGPGLDYGLDLCIDARSGEVVPVELNPALNLGMYARDTDRWLTAVIERTERLAASRA